MKKEFIKIKSKCDNLSLDVAIFIPDKKIKGIVQLSHGMVEHKEYYYEFMEYLTNHGYVTIINDHRGHGKSVKNKNDLGYFYDETSNYVVEDLHDITTYIKERYPNKKVCLLGHSMGSLIVRKYIKKYDYEIDKLIVCGSPSINKMAGLGVLSSKLVRTIKGDRYRSKLLNSLALPNDSTSSWLAYNEDYVKEYKKDKLCGYIFTANGFINLTKLLKEVYSIKNWIFKNPELKIFFIAGHDDPIIVSEKKWYKSINFLRYIGYNNISYKLYSNMKHAILLENDKEAVYKDVLDFIEDK